MVTRIVVRLTSAFSDAAAANVSAATTATNNINDVNRDIEENKKRPLPSSSVADSNSNDNERVEKKRKRPHAFVFDLSDVPPQPPIPKSSRRVKKGTSKYQGVCFNKAASKWSAQLMVEGKPRCIGLYSDEEEAAVDYARAVFKYKGGTQGKDNSFVMDLSDVPPQPPIPKSASYIKEGASKYQGVCFNKRMNKWYAQISIEEKPRFIGYYDDEEEAAVDYARALFKYKPAGEEIVKQQANSFVIDLSDVPPQPPIPKRKGYIKEGAAKYQGVTFNKAANKWQAKISIEGKQQYIGSYTSEEEAAVDYARAVFKYRGGMQQQEKTSC